jgi:hypothetical protein
MLRALPALLAQGLVLCLISNCVLAQTPVPKMPPYQALRRPAAKPQSPAIAQPQIVKAQPYPYGYFGASVTRGQWSSHYGYYDNYSQWTRR